MTDSNTGALLDDIMCAPDPPETAPKQWKVGDTCFIFDMLGDIEFCEVCSPCDEGGIIEMPTDPARRRWVLCPNEKQQDMYRPIWETDRAETEMYPTLYAALYAAIEHETKQHQKFLNRLIDAVSKLKIRGDA